MEFDAGAAVRPRSVIVEVAGREYTIPAMPASEWLLVLERGTWLDIVPGLLPTDDTHIDDQLEAGTLTGDELVRTAREVLQAVCGTRWWIGYRLAYAVTGDPQVAGELVLSGVDTGRISLGALVQAVYRLYTRHADPGKLAQFDARLSEMPEGVTAAEVYDEDRAADDFERMFAARGGR